MAAFSGKVVVITGASEGIGAEIARQVAADKPKLVLGARRIGPLQKIADECGARGARRLRCAATSLPRKLGLWLKMLAPAIVDRMAAAAVKKPK